jgi:hypothetical protein
MRQAASELLARYQPREFRPTGKTGYFISIVPVEKFYEASRIQLEFQAVCEAEESLPSEEG